MSSRQRQARVITNLRGRDGSTDADIAIPLTRAKELRNCDFYRSPFARKRNGSTNVFDTTTGEAFTGVIAALIRHVPGADETAQELWASDTDFVMQRLAGGTAWTTPTFKDAFDADPYDIVGVSFNGKLFLFGNTAVDRLHVWDGSTVRRVGLATPAAPTAADQGAGSLPATIRYYRVRYETRSGSTVINRSEPSASVSWTPSGTGSDVRITKPAAISEGETHWTVEISVDDTVWWVLATGILVATTTYDDDTDVGITLPETLSELAGAHTVPVSAKYGLVDGNRMLLAGSFESTDNESRVWFTPRLGTDEGDDERIPNTVNVKAWVDLDEKDGGAITGLGGPIQGMPVVFKYRQVWKLRPTGEFDAPYQPLAISKQVGCIRHQSIVMGKDENGDPALYWWGFDGPYRLGTRGIQFLGRDIDDLTNALNLDASTVSVFGVYHPDKHQIWFWISRDAENSPGLIAVFDTQLGEPDEDNQVRDGWTTFDGTPSQCRCGVMFSNTLGASMSRDLKPYMGFDTGSVLLKGDTGVLDDNSTPYAAYVRLPEQHLAGLNLMFFVDQFIVLGTSGQHTFQVDLTRNYGVEPRIANVGMEPETDSQTRSQHAFEALFHADCKSIGIQIGDVCPIGHAWEIDALVIQFEPKEGIAP